MTPNPTGDLAAAEFETYYPALRAALRKGEFEDFIRHLYEYGCFFLLMLGEKHREKLLVNGTYQKRVVNFMTDYNQRKNVDNPDDATLNHYLHISDLCLNLEKDFLYNLNAEHHELVKFHIVWPFVLSFFSPVYKECSNLISDKTDEAITNTLSEKFPCLKSEAILCAIGKIERRLSESQNAYWSSLFNQSPCQKIEKILVLKKSAQLGLNYFEKVLSHMLKDSALTQHRHFLKRRLPAALFRQPTVVTELLNIRQQFIAQPK